MQDTRRRDRAAGSLLALAWGDTFGCPVEGWEPDLIARHYGRYEHLPERYPPSLDGTDEGRRLRLRPLGLHSDDTQQALALVAVVLEGFTPERWAEWLVAGAAAGAWRGTGPNFGAALDALRAGVAPTRSGSPSAGIGAAMRSGPLGALLADDRAALHQVAYASASVTHADLRAATTAFAVAHVVAEHVAGRRTADVVANLSHVLEEAEVAWLRSAGDRWTVTGTDAPRISATVAAVLAAGPDGPDALAEVVTSEGRGHLERDVPPHPNHGAAPLGGVHALLAGLLDDRDPPTVLADLVARGGDADTVAAICGSILGARHGGGWVPADRLLDRERLERYAAAVAHRHPPPEDRDGFLAAERALTEREARFLDG